MIIRLTRLLRFKLNEFRLRFSSRLVRREITLRLFGWETTSEQGDPLGVESRITGEQEYKLKVTLREELAASLQYLIPRGARPVFSVTNITGGTFAEMYRTLTRSVNTASRALHNYGKDSAKVAKALRRALRSQAKRIKEIESHGLECSVVFLEWDKLCHEVSGEESVELSAGDFHSGSTFPAIIRLDREQGIELLAAMERGYQPVVWLSPKILTGGKA